MFLFIHRCLGISFKSKELNKKYYYDIFFFIRIMEFPSIIFFFSFVEERDRSLLFRGGCCLPRVLKNLCREGRSHHSQTPEPRSPRRSQRIVFPRRLRRSFPRSPLKSFPRSPLISLPRSPLRALRRRPPRKSPWRCLKPVTMFQKSKT